MVDSERTDADRFDVDVPDTATDEEAAAIVAAIESYLAAERVAGATAGDDRSWSGRRWSFAGRLEDLAGRAARVPASAPGDAWTAAGRADRF